MNNELCERRVEIGDCVLYQGDSSAIIPHLEGIEALVTDPPYGINGGKGGDARDYKKGNYSAEFEDTPEYIEDVCVPVMRDVLSVVQRGAITPGIRCIFHYPEPSDIGCFYTPAAMTHGPWGFVGFNPILYYGKDHRAGRGALPSSTTVTEASPKISHPCPKPIKAWRWLVDKVSLPGEVVVDPFMGSGTTGVACAQMGRKFIGVELDAKYFQLACDRIGKAYEQLDLFIINKKPAKQVSGDLFAD